MYNLPEMRADNARFGEALRELLRAHDWGLITVEFSEREDGIWLSVEDTGIGMSEAVLTGSLLDFGASFWGTTPRDNGLNRVCSSEELQTIGSVVGKQQSTSRGHNLTDPDLRRIMGEHCSLCPFSGPCLSCSRRTGACPGKLGRRRSAVDAAGVQLAARRASRLSVVSPSWSVGQDRG